MKKIKCRSLFYNCFSLPLMNKFKKPKLLLSLSSLYLRRLSLDEFLYHHFITIPQNIIPCVLINLILVCSGIIYFVVFVVIYCLYEDGLSACIDELLKQNIIHYISNEQNRFSGYSNRRK